MTILHLTFSDKNIYETASTLYPKQKHPHLVSNIRETHDYKTSYHIRIHCKDQAPLEAAQRMAQVFKERHPDLKIPLLHKTTEKYYSWNF
jgi:hypothetical protein